MFEVLALLTCRTIYEACAKYGLSVPSSIRRGGKESLIGFLIEKASRPLLDRLLHEAEDIGKVDDVGRKRKRGLDDEDRYDRRCRRREDDGLRVVMPRSNYDTSRFLDLPTGEELRTCYQRFYDATSNRAVEMTICAVCGREIDMWKDDVVEVALREIPHREKLVPHEPHPAHTLYDGCLLESVAVFMGSGGECRVKICHCCWTSLQDGSSALPPPFSLANNLWVGPVPNVLDELTIPEQLLISLLYPRVYVFKLHPKGGFAGNASTLQRGLRGTVSTYEMDLPGILSMVQGSFMPRVPKILASLISVTFVGSGGLPKRWLQNIFRVRRNFVLQALLHLKATNVKYYGHIEISEAALRLLPEDGIPMELLCIIRQCTDDGMIDQESAGYVPSVDDDDQPSCASLIIHSSPYHELTNSSIVFDGADFVVPSFEAESNDEENQSETFYVNFLYEINLFI